MASEAEARKAAEWAREGKELLTEVLYSPGAPLDEAMPRADLPAEAWELLSEAAGQAREAETRFDPRTRVLYEEGVELAKQASNNLELVQMRHGRELPDDVVKARAEALRRLDHITHRS